MPDTAIAGAVGLKLTIDTATLNADMKSAAERASNQFKAAFKNAGANAEKVFSSSFSGAKASANKTSNYFKNAFRSSGNEIKSTFQNSFRGMESAGGSACESLMGMFSKVGGVIAAAFSVSKIIEFGKAAIEQAATVTARESQMTQTFRELEGAAKSAISKVAEESGILDTRLQGVGTQIYAFAKTSGMDSVTALNMMKEALQATADSAAYYDRSLEDTAESLQSFLKGNYANDAALGVSATETTRNAAAMKLYGQSFQNLSEAQKQLTLLQMVKDANALSGAMGQAARESDGWENVIGNLKEAWNQLLAAVGKPILQGAVTVIKTLTGWISKLAEYAKAASAALGDLFGWGNDETAVTATNTADTASSIAKSVDNENKLTQAVAKTNAEVKRGIAGFDKLNLISKSTVNNVNENADKIDNINGAGVNAAVPVLDIDTNNVTNKIDELKEKIISAFQNLAENSGFNNFIDEFRKGLDKVDYKYIHENVEEIVKDVNDIAKETAPGIADMNKSFGTLTGSVAGLAAMISGKAAEVVSGGIRKWLDKDKQYIIDTTNEVTENMGSGFDNLSPIFQNLRDRAALFFDKIKPFTEGVIANALSGVTHAFGELGKFFSGGFKDGAEALKNVYFFFMDDFAPNVMGKIEEIKNWFADLWKNLNDGFHTVVDPWIEIGKRASVWIQTNVTEPIGSFFSDTWNKLSTGAQEAWQGVKDAFSPVTDWFKNTFSEAWSKVKSIFSPGGEAFSGIKEGMTSTFKNIVNGLIDGINFLISKTFSRLNQALRFIHNAEILGVKPFPYINEIDVPEIPHLATGGIVKAPTLAVVGDNAGAGSGNPEVVSPLNQLKQLMGGGDNAKILEVLNRIYEMLYLSRNQGQQQEISVEIDGNTLFKAIVRQNEIYKDTHRGRSAFA